MSAQNKINVTKVMATSPVKIENPLMIDSLNLKGEKFEAQKLLETAFLVKQSDYRDEFVADTAGVIVFPKAKEKNELRYFLFNLNSDRYTKLKIKVNSTGMTELYVDGKKESSKTSEEDSIKNAKSIEKEITVNPGTTTVSVKYLSRALSSTVQESLNISAESKDSLTNLSLYGKRFIGINDIIEGTRIAGGSISPDGRFILLNYSDNVEGNIGRYSRLYEVKTGKKLFIDKDLSWMPVSCKLYYTAQRGAKNSIVCIDPETMSESVFAENVPKGYFRIAPNEKELYYSEKESYEERKGDLLILESPTDRQEGYFDRYFIFRHDIQTGVKQRLTYGAHSTNINDISRDSRYLLFSTGEECITERPFRKSSMFLLDLQTLKIDTLWKNEKYAGSAVFSPDAKKILIEGSPEAFDGKALNVPQGITANSYDIQAYIMDIATKKLEAISKNFNPSINRMTWNTPDEIYVHSVDEDYENVYRYSVSKKTFTKLNLSEDVIRSFQPAKTEAVALYSGQSPSNTTKAYLYDMKTGKSVLIDAPGNERFANITLGEVKDWNFKASDGTVIKGRYYLPPDFDASKKYPVIVYYYGGTTPTARTLDHPYSMHVYAAMGYVVYTLQPSGTIGFGQEFSARHVNAWGKRTADDIIEGTKKFVAEHPFTDEKKIGCIGASYGGFMTMYLQTVTDMFAAAVSHAGISALASYWGEGYWGYAYSAAASANSYPWNNHELYINQSPLYNANKIKTPLLLLHGLEDTNVPVGESFQMFTALKILGKPVEFVRVKGENHGIATYKRRIEWNSSIYAWFAKWLKDDPTWWNSLYSQRK
jgi:dipeptidyl aminopeptidase/acylaminoacyl peptidase